MCQVSHLTKVPWANKKGKAFQVEETPWSEIGKYEIASCVEAVRRVCLILLEYKVQEDTRSFRVQVQITETTLAILKELWNRNQMKRVTQEGQKQLYCQVRSGLSSAQ